jgi:tRNA pseudouridine synthase 10
VRAGLPQVLHRRANLARSRTVHKMHAARLHGQGQYLSLRLRTQAGMYIKEFVHGERCGGRAARGSSCFGEAVSWRA